MDYIGLWKFVAVESRDDNGEKIELNAEEYLSSEIFSDKFRSLKGLLRRRLTRRLQEVSLHLEMI